MRFYQAVFDLLQNITVSVCRGGRIDFGPVQAQAEEVLKQLDARVTVLATAPGKRDAQSWPRAGGQRLNFRLATTAARSRRAWAARAAASALSL